MFRSTRTRSSERGASAVEFALVMPILITLVFGMIDFGWAINRYTVVNNAAREGVRSASLSATEAQIKATITGYLDPGVTTPVITVTCLKPDSTACSGSYDTAKASGGTAIVKVVATQNWLSPLMSTFSANLVLTKEIRMRIE